jgi:hypothetical protein
MAWRWKGSPPPMSRAQQRAEQRENKTSLNATTSSEASSFSEWAEEELNLRPLAYQARLTSRATPTARRISL